MPTVAEATLMAREVLPEWLVPWQLLWFVVGSLLVCLLATICGPALANLGMRSGSTDEWVERARRAYPARAVAGSNRLLLALVLAGGTLAAGWPIPVGLRLSLCVGVFVVVSLLTEWWALRVERAALGREISLGYWCQSSLALALVYRPHVYFLFLLLLLVPDTFNNTTLVVALLTVGPYIFFVLGGGLLVARGIGIVRPASPRLQSVVDRCAESMGIRPRGVCELRWYMSNAFAFPIWRTVAFTDHAVETMSDDDLEAVCSHEFGHLGESNAVTLARVVALLVLFPLGFVRPIIISFGILKFVLLMIFAMAVATLVGRMARRMEERADLVAHEHEEEHGRYAQALESLYRENLMPVVAAQRRAIHPSLYDRMTASGVEPDYPRPDPPSTKRTRFGFLLSLLLVVSWSVIWWLGPRLYLRTASRPASEQLLLWSTTSRLGGANDARILHRLAQYRLAEEDYRATIAFGWMAAHRDHWQWTGLAYVAIASARQSRWAEARQALRLAEDRYKRFAAWARQNQPGFRPRGEPPIIQAARELLKGQ